MTNLAKAEFEINAGSAQLVGETLNLGVSQNLELSDEVEEALNKGIPLVITTDIRLSRQRGLLWDQRIAQWEINRELSFHALSGSYILRDQTQHEFDTFSSLSDALLAAGALSTAWDTASLNLPEGDAVYIVALRVHLDIESFPPPLRLAAYLSPSWRLGSNWEKWPLQM